MFYGCFFKFKEVVKMSKKNEKPIDFKYNLKVYLDLTKKYKWFLYGTIFLVLIIEGIKLLEKYLFKVLIDKGTLFSQGLAIDFMHTLLILSLIFVGIIVTRPLLHWFKMSLLNKFEVSLIQDVKEKFYNHILHLSHTFHTTHKTGSLISRLLRGGHAVEGLTDVIVFNFSPLLLQIIIVGIALVAVYWVSAITMLVMTIIFIVFSFFVQNKMRLLHMESIKYEDREKATVADTFTNIDSVKYFGKEAMMKRRYHSFTEKTKTSLLHLWNKYRYLSFGQDLILLVGLFFIMYFPMKAFIAGMITIGDVVFIYTLFGNLAMPLFSFVHGIRAYYRSMADFESLFQYGKIANDIKDKKNAKQLHIKDGTIVFENISFGYGNYKLFKKFNLSIKKNEKIALVGHSGCGKSSLIKLLYRLLDVQEGRILIDGIDIRDVQQEPLRSELSIVPQEGVLFDDTIYNNIKFTNSKATRKDVIAAMKFSQLYDVVQQFPKKEQTIVGERGVKLSGGEKQRVSIARALLANKKVLILDEATSALDSQTEHNIQRDLERLMEGRTSIIIAHRLSTIMKADRIIVLEHGRIVQMGSHKELIKTKGHYRKLWDLQKGGYLD